MEDDPVSRFPATEENIDRVHYVMVYDRQLTVNQINDAINISHERTENILHNKLGVTKVTARKVQVF